LEALQSLTPTPTHGEENEKKLFFCREKKSDFSSVAGLPDSQTKNPNLGKFWRVFQWKMLVHLKVIWSILLALSLFDVRIL
jgi:hypothetical protein